MSFSEFENWNPMADHYSSTMYNSYTDAYSSQIDPKSLYIKSIPAELTEDTFLSLFSEGGERIKKHLLYPPKPNKDMTCGIVSYDKEIDASAAKARLNGKPPLYLKIDYATDKKKKQPPDQKIPSVNERVCGRQGVSGTSGGSSNTPGTSGLRHLATIGRGRAVAPDALHNLKVHVDGDKRTAYQHSESFDKLRESSNSPDFPDLIPNLCLVCKKKGDLSCGKCRQNYCSVNCQRQDWPKHKSICKSLCTSLSKQNQFANDSSYMSEGSSSDNDKMNNNLPVNRPFNRNQSGSCQSQGITSAKSRVSQASTINPHMPVKETASSNNGIQKKFIRANELQKQELYSNKQYKVTVCKICSPSNFWIHLDGSAKVLYQMEKEMTSMVQKIPVKCAVDDVCCTFENGKFLRVKILELTPKSSIAEFIDYGGTSALLNDKLYFLPQMFKKYQTQAIGCNLVDGASQDNVAWSDEDVSSFEYHTKDKVFIGHVHGFVKNVHNIALMNEEGVSMYSILKASHMVDLGGFSQAKRPVTIPSVLSDLKDGAQVTLGSLRFEEDKIWGILDNGSRTKALKELENCLQKVETEDISLTCEEGDLAVGFSFTLNQFYRCVILKRLRNSFLVRYIDYGNTERITKLQSLSPILLQKKSYVICCEKPTSLSIDDFDSTHIVTVKRIDDTEVELSFRYKNGLVVMRCYPWYHGSAIESLIKSHSSVSFSKSPKNNMKAAQSPRINKDSQSPRTNKDSQSPRTNKDSQSPRTNKDSQSPRTNKDSLSPRTNKASQSPRTKITLDSRQLPSESETAHKSIITKNLIPEKKLDAASRHDVKVVWIKDASEIYVQLIKDEDAIGNLFVSINKYCNSESYSAYPPKPKEIVCCKFSDEVWYRAEVTGRNKYKYKVFFIDYGNEAEVSISDIKPLHPKFATVPKLSYCISLYGIRNEDVTKELLDKLLKETWSLELNFKQTPEVMLYLEGKPFTDFIIKEKNHSKTLLQYQQLPAGISDVVICFKQTDKIYIHQQKDLKNLLLLQTKIGSLVKTDVSKPEIGKVYCCLAGDGCWYRGLVKKILSDSICVNFIDYGNDEEILIKNLKELSDDLFSHPVYCVPLIIQNLKLSELNLEAVFSVEVVGKKDGIQLAKVINLPQNTGKPKISDLKRLSLGEGVNKVKLLFYENDIFYCHLRNNFEDIDILSQKLMNLELKPLNETPTEGDLVCAKSSDGRWYRASVQKTFTEEATFKVLFIDYGNCEDVPSENIQCISEDLLNFPVLCVPVKITNFEKVKNSIDIDSVLSLKTVGFSDEKVRLVELVLPRKTILPKSNSLKKQSLQMDKEIDVSLIYASGDNLFVHIVSSKELLKTLESKLLKASEFSDLSDLPEIGDVICAKSVGDGIWYRGSVEKIFTDQKSCEICFIDYGNNEVIQLENMKILPTSLYTFPVLSVPVKFKSMEKLHEKINAGIDTFSVRVIESSDTIFTVDLVVPEDNVQLSSIESEMLPEAPVKVMIVYKEAGVFYIQRISNAEKLQKMTYDLQNPSFLKKLLHLPKIGELCNVKYDDGQFYRAIIKEQSSENRFKVFFVDYGNVDVVVLENIYCIPSNYSTMPGLCTAVKFDEPGNVEHLNSNSMCTIKYTGVSEDNVHVVKLCPAVIPISSIKQSNLDTAVQDVIFLSFDGEFHFLSKTSDSVEINEMNAILEKFEGDEIDGIPTVDEVLVVKCKKGSWCRGSIKSVNETSKTCKVFLIDYGTTEDLPFSDISYMPEKLSTFPKFCIKVTVKNSIFIADSAPFGKQFSAAVIGRSDDGVPIIDIFKQYMLSSLTQQRLPLNELRNVVFYHQDGDIFFLQDVNENDVKLLAEVQLEVKKLASSDPLFRNPIVGELLCARSQADGSWYRCCVEEIVSSDKCRIRFIDYGNDEIVMKENLRSFVGELAMYPSFAIPVRIIDNKCAKSTVQLEHVYSAIAVSLENTVQLVKLMLQHDSHIQVPSEDIPLIDHSTNSKTEETRLQPSDRESSLVKEVCPPTCSNPEVKFLYSTSDYIDFPDGEQDIIMYYVTEECSLFCAPFNCDAIEANLQLTREISKYCENLETSSYNGKSLPESDELVLAKYNADNLWYRAVVIDDSNHPFYDVIFIDYGNTERVSIDFMRKMEKDFMSLPVQARLCSITGFTIDDRSLSDAIKEMQTFVVFVNPAPLKAFVSSNEEEKSVNIPMITEHLLEKKLVTAIES